MIQNLLGNMDLKPLFRDKLANLGINTYWDLLLHIPLRYEDLTKIYPLSVVNTGMEVLIEGEIISCEIIHKRTRQLYVKIGDGSGFITLIFFHFYANYASQYKLGKKIRAYGEIKADFFGNKTIIHPKVQTVTENLNLPNTFTPIYLTTNGVSQLQLIKLIDETLQLLDNIDILPSNLVEDLPSFPQAICILHKLTPKQFADGTYKKALDRLKLDELLAQQLVLYSAYQHKYTNQAVALKPKDVLTKKLLDNLPFKLTTSQVRVLNEIYADIASPVQMNRLLQGDVGSGKTIIAILSMLVAVENCFQACIVAPTEILAEQHYIKTTQLLANFGVNIVWLSGSLTKKEKDIAYTSISLGEAQIIIGTHAILQKMVEFNNLALIVVDEQHRFGVEQRLLLQSKGSNPHQLMMSATPIPRTLAMSYYADLDVSTIDELPIGRKPIKTLLINNNRRSEVIKFIQDACRNRAQIYWVCPLIEESEKLNLENVINVFNELSVSIVDATIEVLHGKLKSYEKAEIMTRFCNGQIDILVATTVIEVGVDIPNASIMVIEHSERMGLSSLHQLRGRVGRGSMDSQCILLYHYPLSNLAKQRLKAIYENSDGFAIANLDLAIRGPGEILGNRQSGLPLLKFADLETDLELLKKAKRLAKVLHDNYHIQAKQYIDLWFHNLKHLLNV